ncbi:MAG: Glu-tRNA(Gln) amidotransferase subunit GatE [Ignavibacteriales bacterium]|nr:Glu-tRNA(Gln) amidotransferase subunit GatE [Ignavibacteriales bacterium]
MHKFIFKPFDEMTEKDYAMVGFKSGLEIHQQLLTEKKLFCRCPAGRYSDKYDAEILRHMRPTLSELGEYDGTALMEFKTKKEIIYRIKRETVCTYEMDDTPPFQIDEHALDSALAIGMLYGCTMVDEVHIARKQYLDGSIPTGFQRTAIVGVDGKIPYKNREIKIIQLSIEEDACREVSDIGHRRVYITDRLGMPLIETVTGPDMRTPIEVAEVAQICRRLVRSTGRVRTGIGAGREDVNVSVTGGTRIEIKGVPRIVSIPLLTYNEAMRQWNLLRLREELKRRGITEKSFKSKTENVTKILRKTRYQPIQNAIEQGMKINCVLLQGYKGLLRWQTQTDTYFSREISDRVRVVACLTTLPNIIHSDSSGDTIAASEWQNIKKQIGGKDDDTLVLVWGDEQDANTGAQEIVIRAKEATIGIPSETRQAFRDGTNGFERILPGPDRMYPDTDLPPKRIEDEKLEKLCLTLPNRIWENEKWYRKLKIPPNVIEPLAASKYTKLFEMLVKNSKLNPTFVAVALIQYQKRLKTYFPKAKQIEIETFEEIFEAFKSGIISREGIFLAMKSFLESGKLRFAKKIKSTELTKVIKDSKIATKKMKIQNEEKKTEILIGLIMNKVRGKIDGKLVADKIGFSGKGKR